MHGATKREDGTLLFRTIRYAISEYENEKYFVFCDWPVYTPKHQQLEWKELVDRTHHTLANSLGNLKYADYIQEVLVLTDKKIQNIFIERVTFMIRKYETFNIIKRL